MLIFSACNLPDPDTTDYDYILNEITHKLDAFVENDYVVILFSGGMVKRPGWTWLFRAYKRLNRNYKKNLKRLYVVHPATWVRIVMDTMNTVVSPKFKRKLVWANTLSELAQHVPLRRVGIPDAVIDINLTYESHITYAPLPVLSKEKKCFGVPLNELMGHGGEKGLPRVLVDAMTYLRQDNRLKTEGLFRKSANSAELAEIKAAYDAEQVVDLEEYNSEHLAAVLIKLFLRELHEPMFTETMYGDIQALPVSPNHSVSDAQVEHVQHILQIKSPSERLVLEAVTHLLYECTTYAKSNRMTAATLSTVITPNLLRGHNPLQDIALCATQPGGGKSAGNVLRICIEAHDRVFSDYSDVVTMQDIAKSLKKMHVQPMAPTRQRKTVSIDLSKAPPPIPPKPTLFTPSKKGVSWAEDI